VASNRSENITTATGSNNPISSSTTSDGNKQPNVDANRADSEDATQAPSKESSANSSGTGTSLPDNVTRSSSAVATSDSASASPVTASEIARAAAALPSISKAAQEEQQQKLNGTVRECERQQEIAQSLCQTKQEQCVLFRPGMHMLIKTQKGARSRKDLPDSNMTGKVSSTYDPTSQSNVFYVLVGYHLLLNWPARMVTGLKLRNLVRWQHMVAGKRRAPCMPIAMGNVSLLSYYAAMAVKCEGHTQFVKIGQALQNGQLIIAIERDRHSVTRFISAENNDTAGVKLH
jgi:hypothetical protein